MPNRFFKLPLTILVTALFLTGLAACEAPFKWKQPSPQEEATGSIDAEPAAKPVPEVTEVDETKLGPREAGEDCASDVDCLSRVCTNKVCQAASCDDGIENGDESDVDCGGSCPPCQPLQTCNGDADCVEEFTPEGSTTVYGPFTCETESLGQTLPEALCINENFSAAVVAWALAVQCNNGKQDGDESDVDCGGSCPQQCLPFKKCNETSDCLTEFTPEGGTTSYGPFVCQETSLGLDLPESQCINEDFSADAAQYALALQCINGQQDGDETDVDCGGSCAQKCLPFQKCNAKSDCVAAYTQTGFITDYGPFECQATSLGKALPESQCINEQFSADVVTWLDAMCRNGQQDGDETGVDCGGWCAKCVGEACTEDNECATGSCEAGVCAQAWVSERGAKLLFMGGVLLGL